MIVTKIKTTFMRKIFAIALLFICSNLLAQDAIEYQIPPKEIYDLVMAKPTPGVSFHRRHTAAVEYQHVLSFTLEANTGCGLCIPDRKFLWAVFGIRWHPGPVNCCK